MKKLFSSLAVFAVALMAVVMAGSTEVQATTFENIKVYEVSEMTNFDSKIGLSWEKTWSLNEDAGVESQTVYGKFTLTKDSIVRIKTILKDEKAFAADDIFYVYSNSAMATPILERSISYGSSDDFMELEAGTYYVECKSTLYMESVSAHTTKMMIGAIPATNPITVEQNISADRKKMTICVTPKYAATEEIYKIRWEEGKDAKINTLSDEADSNRCFVVTENGWYTVYISVSSTVGFNEGIEYTMNIKVSGIGPGAKKGVTYTINNVQYKLVKAGFDGKGTVMVTGVKKAKATVTIPNKVNIGNHDYQVVKINKKAFYKKSKIKNVVIKATGITSIGKNAFKGINPKATITVPKAKYAKYKKMLTAKTGFAKKTMKLKKK